MSVLSALQYWKYLTQMLFNSAPCSARERLFWSWVCQLLVEWNIQVDQFLVDLTVLLKQDYVLTGLNTPQSGNKIFNWQPLRGKNETF